MSSSSYLRVQQWLARAQDNCDESRQDGRPRLPKESSKHGRHSPSLTGASSKRAYLPMLARHIEWMLAPRAVGEWGVARHWRHHAGPFDRRSIAPQPRGAYRWCSMSPFPSGSLNSAI
jgi:hypothetical protein